MEVGLAPRQGGCLLSGMPCACRPGLALAPGGQALLSQPRAPPHRAWALRGSARQGHREALWVFWPLSVLLLSLCLMLHSVPRARQRRKCFLSVVPLLSAGMLWNPPSEQSTTSLSPPPLLLPSRPESISETSWRLHWRVWFFTLFNKSYWELGGFPGGTSGKEPACQCKRRQVRSLGWEDPLEKGAATRSRILAWRIPGTEEPGGLQSMGSQRGRHDWSDLARNESSACSFPGNAEENLPSVS